MKSPMVKADRTAKRSPKRVSFEFLRLLDVSVFDSPATHVLLAAVIATPAMLMTTETTLTKLIDSSPISAPITRVKIPEVEDNNVVLATLVLASAAFVKYCKKQMKRILSI